KRSGARKTERVTGTAKPATESKPIFKALRFAAARRVPLTALPRFYAGCGSRLLLGFVFRSAFFFARFVSLLELGGAPFDILPSCAGFLLFFRLRRFS